MASNNLKDLGTREATPVVMIVGVAILVLALGAGGFYAFNGGWKTQSQQEQAYQHEVMPILAAKHGDKEALDAENKLRKEHGEAPLEMPKDNKGGVPKDPNALQKLQDQLRAKGAGGG
jgi:hypothetical protein